MSLLATLFGLNQFSIFGLIILGLGILITLAGVAFFNNLGFDLPAKVGFFMILGGIALYFAANIIEGLFSSALSSAITIGVILIVTIAYFLFFPQKKKIGVKRK